MKILGPVVTSKSIGKSYIQIRDLIPLAKKYNYDGIAIIESHPKSWISFIKLCKYYKLKPIIFFEMKDKVFLPKNSSELKKIVKIYNGLNENLHFFDKKNIFNKIVYPTKRFSELLNDIDGDYIKKNSGIENYINKNIYKYILKTNFEYDIKNFFVGIPKIGGFKKLYENILPTISKLPDNYVLRLKNELEVIRKLNVSDYILTVKKIVDIAKKNGSLIGPGRGSAVGSLVVYLLGITLIDPIKYNLYFERFLNLSRQELPDIDLDVESEKRDIIINELSKEFDIAQVRTYVRMKYKSVFKKIKEILNLDYSNKFKKPIRSIENMKLYKNDKLKDYYTLAFYLEGLETAESVHAAGIILSDKNLKEYIPLEFSKNIPVTIWEMEELKEIGIEKFDLLSLDTLSLLKKFDFKYSKDYFINLNNKKVFNIISKGLTEGIFQLESKSAKILAKKLNPQTFEELYILLALNRPGPLNSGMFDEYLDGSSKEYLKKLLPETKGVIIFQEQVMYLAQKLGNLSPYESDNFRKAISKKNIEKIEILKEKFILNASKKIGENEAKVLYKKIENFSQYAFNKSHSVAYAHLSYWLAEIKSTQPERFYLEYIKYKGFSFEIFKEINMMNINIILPNINIPFGDYKNKTIILPLRIIKGVGEFAEKKIFEDIQNKGKYTSFENFIKRAKSIGITRNIIEQMIKGGTFDIFDKNRRNLLRAISEIEMNASSTSKKILSNVFGENIKNENKKIITSKKDIVTFEKEVFNFVISKKNY
ncbi:DNA polymerase-3 subunit alpha [Marinitoga hydrogenitolerans DSM 16785]|uniref:DNA-directed DNA polymerase n=1 Tax=Marinitoga hydrogenitolerans (strain DSM 16785 / JCM 12826 / AT1271) TaxID=1122195 RepID=A0A1M4S4G5_MARH1|nr:DNA polymerase III subunit alpha [Marinitoga hydrogenitolerans]SHE27091.1 DNA polymerase-3 subunit alpha [Marinitoga hydrogenitolerans DSM 16785]